MCRHEKDCPGQRGQEEELIAGGSDEGASVDVREVEDSESEQNGHQPDAQIQRSPPSWPRRSAGAF